MSSRLTGRLTKLEAAIVPPQPRRCWLICKRPVESTADALTRHGIEAELQDKIIVLRYGCPTCRATRVP